MHGHDCFRGCSAVEFSCIKKPSWKRPVVHASVILVIPEIVHTCTPDVFMCCTAVPTKNYAFFCTTKSRQFTLQRVQHTQFDKMLDSLPLMTSVKCE